MSNESADRLEQIERFQIPHLRENAVVVAARQWPANGPGIKDDAQLIRFLDRFMNDDFPAYFHRPVKFATAGAQGEGRISNDCPQEEDFQSAREFQTAFDLWEEHYHQPGPWQQLSPGRKAIGSWIRYVAKWNVNDRGSVSAKTGEDKQALKERVALEQAAAVEQLIERICDSFSEEVRTFRTDQILENAEDCGWGCYHDKVYASVDREHFIVTYFGFDRYWG